MRRQVIQAPSGSLAINASVEIVREHEIVASISGPIASPYFSWRIYDHKLMDRQCACDCQNATVLTCRFPGNREKPETKTHGAVVLFVKYAVKCSRVSSINDQWLFVLVRAARGLLRSPCFHPPPQPHLVCPDYLRSTPDRVYTVLVVDGIAVILLYWSTCSGKSNLQSR